MGLVGWLGLGWVWLGLVVCLLACLVVCLFVCLLGCLFVCLLACLLAWLFVCLFVCVCLFVFVSVVVVDVVDVVVDVVVAVVVLVLVLVLVVVVVVVFFWLFSWVSRGIRWLFEMKRKTRGTSKLIGMVQCVQKILRLFLASLRCLSAELIEHFPCVQKKTKFPRPTLQPRGLRFEFGFKPKAAGRVSLAKRGAVRLDFPKNSR